MAIKVLLVEDDRALREALADTLLLAGHDYRAVGSAEDALDAVEQETFSHTEVQQQLAHYRLLRVDLSNMDTEQRALLAELQVTGLPAIQFFGQAAEPLARIDGFLPPQLFLPRLPAQCQPQAAC